MPAALPHHTMLRVDPVLEEARRHGSAVGEWAGLIGRELGLDGKRLGRLVLGAQLHDLGKVEVPRAILTNPGRLSTEEWRVVRRHPEVGARLLSHPFFEDIRPFVLHHHERYDGLGYPHGLFGRSIPLEARVIAVADAWCAMTSDRPYRAALADARAIEEVHAGAGTQFDPECAGVLLGLVSPPARERPGVRLLPSAAAPARPGA